MRANELRIGNLIQKNGKIHYTNNLTIRDIFHLSIDDTDIFEPIPITEDWLLKCGFEKDEYEMFVFNRKVIYKKNDNTFHFYGCDIEIKHIHQLQNLYFALTGEELEINL